VVRGRTLVGVLTLEKELWMSCLGAKAVPGG
jgi:hypothetical protein